MRIAVIGTGYVGLVSGVCFSDFGHEVVCIDKDPRKIEMLERGEVPIYEPGLDVLMHKNVEAGRLSFTLDLESAIDGAQAVFIAVGTPTRRGDGHADLRYVMAAAEEIARAARHHVVVVTKSTVPVGPNRQVRHLPRPLPHRRDVHPHQFVGARVPPDALDEDAAGVAEQRRVSVHASPPRP